MLHLVAHQGMNPTSVNSRLLPSSSSSSYFSLLLITLLPILLSTSLLLYAIIVHIYPTLIDPQRCEYSLDYMYYHEVNLSSVESSHTHNQIPYASYTPYEQDEQKFISHYHTRKKVKNLLNNTEFNSKLRHTNDDKDQSHNDTTDEIHPTPHSDQPSSSYRYMNMNRYKLYEWYGAVSDPYQYQVQHDQKHRHRQRKQPVIFIPGNGGSYKQARWLFSYLHDVSHPASVQWHGYKHLLNTHHESESEDDNKNHDVDLAFSYYSVDFNEEYSAYSSAILHQQVDYLMRILQMLRAHRMTQLLIAKEKYRHDMNRQYENVDRLPIIIGHSVGGLVALTLPVLYSHTRDGTSVDTTYPSDLHFLVDSIVTLGTPLSPHHSIVPFLHDYQMSRIMKQMSQYWSSLGTPPYQRDPHQRDTVTPFIPIPILSIHGGWKDFQVPDYSLHGYAGNTYHLTDHIPRIGFSVDHAPLCWCNQLVRTLGDTIIEYSKEDRKRRDLRPVPQEEGHQNRLLPSLVPAQHIIYPSMELLMSQSYAVKLQRHRHPGAETMDITHPPLPSSPSITTHTYTAIIRNKDQTRVYSIDIQAPKSSTTPPTCTYYIDCGSDSRLSDNQWSINNVDGGSGRDRRMNCSSGHLIYTYGPTAKHYNGEKDIVIQIEVVADDKAEDTASFVDMTLTVHVHIWRTFVRLMWMSLPLIEQHMLEILVTLSTMRISMWQVVSSRYKSILFLISAAAITFIKQFNTIILNEGESMMWSEVLSDMIIIYAAIPIILLLHCVSYIFLYLARSTTTILHVHTVAGVRSGNSNGGAAVWRCMKRAAVLVSMVTCVNLSYMMYTYRYDHTGLHSFDLPVTYTLTVAATGALFVEIGQMRRMRRNQSAGPTTSTMSSHQIPLQPHLQSPPSPSQLAAVSTRWSVACILLFHTLSITPSAVLSMLHPSIPADLDIHGLVGHLLTTTPSFSSYLLSIYLANSHIDVIEYAWKPALYTYLVSAFIMTIVVYIHINQLYLYTYMTPVNCIYLSSMTLLPVAWRVYRYGYENSHKFHSVGKDD